MTPASGVRLFGPKVRAAVLAATLDELAKQGYAALTIDDVARRAEVHNTTVYRCWQTRENLIVDALTEHMVAGISILDSGDVETELRELARAFVVWMTSHTAQAVLAATLSQDAARVPEIAAIKRRVVDERFRRAEPVVTRASRVASSPPTRIRPRSSGRSLPRFTSGCWSPPNRLTRRLPTLRRRLHSRPRAGALHLADARTCQ